jgi:hypothetical protein
MVCKVRQFRLIETNAKDLAEQIEAFLTTTEDLKFFETLMLQNDLLLIAVFGNG